MREVYLKHRKCHALVDPDHLKCFIYGGGEDCISVLTIISFGFQELHMTGDYDVVLWTSISHFLASADLLVYHYQSLDLFLI